MELKQEFKDLFKKDQTIIHCPQPIINETYKVVDNQYKYVPIEREIDFIKTKLPFDDGYALYYSDKISTEHVNNINSLHLIGLIDNDFNFTYIADNFTYHERDQYRFLLTTITDINFVDLEKSNVQNIIAPYNKREEFEEEAKKILLDFYESKKEEFEKQYKYEKYKTLGKEYYSKSKEELLDCDPINHFDPNYSTDIIAALHQNKLKEYILGEYGDQYEKKYREYYFGLKAKEDYAEEISKDPILMKNKKIIDILLDPSYQSFRIFHTLPDGTEKEFSFKKNIKKYGNLKESIIKNNEICDIPIDAIDKIVYRKTILVDKNDYAIPPYNLRDLAIKYAECANRDVDKILLKNFGTDRDIMGRLVGRDTWYIDKIDPSLYYDADFFLDTIGKYIQVKNNQYWKVSNILNSADKTLFESNDFINKLIDVLEGTENRQLIQQFPFENKIKECAVDTNLILKLLNCQNIQPTFEIFKISPLSLKDEKIIEKIKEINTDTWAGRRYILPNIDNAKLLFEMFDIDTIGKNLLDLHENILNDKDAILKILHDAEGVVPIRKTSASSMAPFDTSFIEYYKDDKTICMEIAKHLTSFAQVDQFLSVVCDGSNEKDMVLDFAFYNILFIDKLSKKYYDSMDDFLYAVSDPEEINEVKIITYPKKLLYDYVFETENETIIIEENGGELYIGIKDKLNSIYDLSHLYNDKIVRNNIKSFLEKEFNAEFKKEELTKRELRKALIIGKTEEEIENFTWKRNNNIEIEK